MTTKCTGLMGRIFGHKWHIAREVIKPKVKKCGFAFYTDVGIRFIEYGVCQRCGVVTGEKK